MNTPAPQRWQTVYNGLRDAIDQRQLAAGDPLGTEAELAASYGVGRDAVRRALQRLESHGLITSSRGPYGRRVREYAPLVWALSEFEVAGKRVDNPQTGTDNWASGIRAQGREPSEQVQLHSFAARDDVAHRAAGYLDVTDPDEWLLRRRRWRYADGELISIADTWLLDEVSKLPATSENGGTIYPFREERSVALPGGIIHAVGLRQPWTRHLHRARHPSTDEAALLDIEPSEPIAEVVIIGFDQNDRRFRAMITISPGDRLAAQYDLQLESDEGNKE